jgi:hypothetical protein
MVSKTKRAKNAAKKAVKAVKAAAKIVKLAQDIPVLNRAPAVKHPMESIGGLAGPLGRSIGRVMGTVVGTGDYTVKMNSLSTEAVSMLGGDVPRFSKTDDGYGTIVRHTELLTDVISSLTPGGFSAQILPINPGNATSFPWLSTIAQCYDQWKPLGMIYCFISTSGDNATSQALGSVMLATDYDVTDPPYPNKAAYANSQYSKTGKPSVCYYHPIECDPGQRPVEVLKVRSTASPSDNAQWYDLGNFQIASVGVPASLTTLGELYVTYEIALYKEQLPTAPATTLFESQFAGTGASSSNYLGTARTSPVGNSLAVSFPTNSSFTIDTGLAIGSFFSLMISWVGTTQNCTTPTLTPTACVVAAVTAGNNAQGASYNGGAITDDQYTQYQVFRVTGSNPTVGFSTGVVPASATINLAIRSENPALFT